ncbi:hypothetical protein DQ04_01481080 [Trypanosoma grayi]|uniref:hypothetical protein n=1 Tax=Trypanosoma grayi TaxID=71804 RepID=UPI0004F46A2E|nr:hypothetical protein DQ04_01481080 [Trypanosoma grayi]KEG12705.1 hypothetical protein DQ04_01481080 [Trypanosoma grayi]
MCGAVASTLILMLLERAMARRSSLDAACPTEAASDFVLSTIAARSMPFGNSKNRARLLTVGGSATTRRGSRRRSITKLRCVSSSNCSTGLNAALHSSSGAPHDDKRRCTVVEPLPPMLSSVDCATARPSTSVGSLASITSSCTGFDSVRLSVTKCSCTDVGALNFLSRAPTLCNMSTTFSSFDRLTRMLSIGRSNCASNQQYELGSFDTSMMVVLVSSGLFGSMPYDRSSSSKASSSSSVSCGVRWPRRNHENQPVFFVSAFACASAFLASLSLRFS